MKTELIKKYLANELSNDERYAFELEMENDPFLKEAMDGFENLSEDNNQWSIEKTEENLHQQIDKKVVEIKADKKVIFMNFFKIAAAACVVGIVAFSTWRFIFQKNGTFDNNYYSEISLDGSNVINRIRCVCSKRDRSLLRNEARQGWKFF